MFRMQTKSGENHFISIGLNFGLTILSVFPTWIVLSELEHTHEVQVVAEEVQTKGNEEQMA